MAPIIYDDRVHLLLMRVMVMRWQTGAGGDDVDDGEYDEYHNIEHAASPGATANSMGVGATALHVIMGGAYFVGSPLRKLHGWSKCRENAESTFVSEAQFAF